MAAPPARELEPAAHDPLDLARVVLARVVDRAVAANALRAEVETADELAHGQQVDVVEHRRTEIRVRVERAAQREQALLGTDVRRVELGIADRPLEDRGRAAARRERLLGQRLPGRPDRSRADQPFIDLDVGRQQLEREARLLGDLRPDPVPRQEDDPRGVTHPKGLPPTRNEAGGRAAAA